MAESSKEAGEIIRAFADDVQDLLDMDKSPLQTTCDDYSDSLVYPYLSSACLPECIFGEKITVDSCVCDTGFWNVSCNAECPGGASDPCSGYGACDPLTGECPCPLNRRGSANCSLCSEDWLGSDCSISENTGVISTMAIAAVTRLGHHYNLDGLGFMVIDPGEFLMLSVGRTVLIEAKSVSCYSHYTCITFIAIRVGDDENKYTVITAQTSKMINSKINVFENGQIIHLDEKLFYHGFDMERPSLKEVKLTVNGEISVVITLQGIYLQMMVTMPLNLISQTHGLLSGCGQSDTTTRLSHLTDSTIPVFCPLSPPSQTGRPGTPQDTTLTYTSIVGGTQAADTLDVNRYLMTDCNFVHYPSEEDRRQTIGGFNLKFERSVAYTEITLTTEPGADVTIDFLVKLNGSSGGVLFSFVNEKSFYVSYNSSISIHYDGGVYPTDLGMTEEEWNKIVIVYDSGLGSMDIYHYNGSGYIERRTIELPLNIFDEPGTLVVGHWQPPHDGQDHSIPQSLKGQIDNFIIWTIPMRPNVMVDIWQIDPLGIAQLLRYSWLFDEGGTTETIDNIAQIPLHLPVYPWNIPSWVPSDLKYNRNIRMTLTGYKFSTDSYRLKAEEMKTNMTAKSVMANCTYISMATKDFFTLASYHAYSVTHTDDSLYDVYLMLGEICKVMMNLDTSPYTAVCDRLEPAIRTKTICPSRCGYGSEIDGDCECATGYYGATCHNICPGSSIHPCSNHGTCEADGQCSCEWNWGGGAGTCNTCLGLLAQPECKVLKVDALLGGNLAYITSTCDYMSFTGQQFSMSGETGVFRVFQTDSIDIHVYQVTCHFGTCVSAVSVNKSNTIIVIHPPGQETYPKIFQDGERVTVDSKVLSLNNGITVNMNALYEIEVVTSTLTVTIHLQGQFMMVILKTSNCVSGTGVLDECKGSYNAADKFSSEIISYMTTNFRLNQSPLLKTLSDSISEMSDSNSGFALLFNNTGAVSSYPLSFASNFSYSNRDFSLTVYIKPYSLGGVILSYSKTTDFAIINTAPLTIKCDQTIVDTGINLAMKNWNQLVFTFYRSTGKLHLFHYGEADNITFKVLDFSCSEMMDNGGSLSLGVMMPSTGADKYEMEYGFEGMIDDISLWKDPIPAAYIMQANKLNVRLSGFQSAITSLFCFLEGGGQTAFDEIDRNDLSMPTAPWQYPTWVVSDLQLRILKTVYAGELPKHMISQDIKNICADFFDHSTVTSQCPTNEIGTVYKGFCMEAAAGSGNKTDIFVVMVNYISLCIKLGGSENLLYKLLCSLDVPKQSWLDKQCGNCKFGYPDKDGSCVCYYGYHGTNCENICPNGPADPCNNHGTCDTNGVCQCSGHWAGSDCGMCSNFWQPNECVVMVTTLDQAKSSWTGQISLSGQMTTFDGIKFDISTAKTYRLVSVTSLDIQLYAVFSRCDNSKLKHFCLISLVMEHDSGSHAITTDAFKENEIIIKSTTAAQSIYETATIGSALFKRTTKTNVKINFSTLDFTISITLVESRLLVTMALSKADRNAHEMDGLLALCKTVNAIKLSTCGAISLMNCSAISEDVSACPSGTLNSADISAFIATYEVVSETIKELLGNQEQIVKSTCLFFNDNGQMVDPIDLPGGYFTIEFQIKLMSYGGIILSFKSGEVDFFLINGEQGLRISSGLVTHNTGIMVELRQWNQISLHWRSDLALMEVYRIDSVGSVVIKAVRLTFSLFDSEGSLSLGQARPGHFPPVSAGIFIGYIDELRIWQRAHNPTIVARNWKMKVTANTPNLYYNWGFDDGMGVKATEWKQSKHMFAIDINKAPEWTISEVVYDMIISEVVLSTKVPVDDNVQAEAEQVCKDLLQDLALLDACPSLTEVLDAAETECVNNVVSSGSTAEAETSLLGAAEMCQFMEKLTESPAESMCNSFSSLSSLIVKFGDNCDQLCTFGNLLNGTCVCDPGHWGEDCNSTCLMATKGPCNLVAQCFTGECSCPSRWLGGGEEVIVKYWKNALNLQKTTLSNYACSSCTEGWHGPDCNIAVEAMPESVSDYVGVLYGSYVTNLDGGSYEITMPGIYEAFTHKDSSIQVLFWPCQEKHGCRRLQQVSVRGKPGKSSISVYMANGVHFTVDVRKEGEIEQLTFNPNTTLKKSYSGGISIKWRAERHVRISLSGMSVVVTNSKEGLVARFKVSSSVANQCTGLLGRIGKNWFSNLLAPGDTFDSMTAEKMVSAGYISTWLKNTYGLTKAANHINQSPDTLHISSAGYMLHLNNEVRFTGLNISNSLTAMTVGVWILVQDSTISMNIMVVNTGTHDFILTVKNGLVELTWDQTLTTVLTITAKTWTYIAVAWQSSDGQLNIYTVTNGQNLQTQAFVNILTLQTISFDNIVFAGAVNNYVEIDYLRLWPVLKTVDEVMSDMKTYSTGSNPSLVLTAAFDEGHGFSTKLYVFESPPRSVTGIIQSTANVWVPSTIITTDDALIDSITWDNDIHTVEGCMDAITNTNLTEECPDLAAVKDLYLEACIRESRRLGSSALKDTAIIATETLIFFCQAVHGVDDCLFDGYFDYCEPIEDELFPLWVIGVIAGAVVFLLIIIVCCCCYFKKKADAKRAIAYGDMAMGDEQETAFVTWDDCSNSAIPPRSTSVELPNTSLPLEHPEPVFIHVPPHLSKTPLPPSLLGILADEERSDSVVPPRDTRYEDPPMAPHPGFSVSPHKFGTPTMVSPPPPLFLGSHRPVPTFVSQYRVGGPKKSSVAAFLSAESRKSSMSADYSDTTSMGSLTGGATTDEPDLDVYSLSSDAKQLDSTTWAHRPSITQSDAFTIQASKSPGQRIKPPSLAWHKEKSKASMDKMSIMSATSHPAPSNVEDPRMFVVRSPFSPMDDEGSNSDDNEESGF